MNGQHITIVDLRIPFLRLVFFFVKVAFAAIPAAIIFAALAMAIMAILATLFGTHMDFMMRRGWV